MFVVWLIGALVVVFGFVVFFGAPYVPSKKRDLSLALDELYALGRQDVLVDIGSGDGVVLREAARRGAKAVGYELNPLLVLVSRFLCRRWPGVKIYLANFWHVSLPSDTTVVYTFGESRDIAKMARKVEDEATRLARPLMFISYGVKVPGKTPYGAVGAHHLYEYKPRNSGAGSLQPEEA